jgi:hypothetical protein
VRIACGGVLCSLACVVRTVVYAWVGGVPHHSTPRGPDRTATATLTHPVTDVHRMDPGPAPSHGWCSWPLHFLRTARMFPMLQASVACMRWSLVCAVAFLDTRVPFVAGSFRGALWSYHACARLPSLRGWSFLQIEAPLIPGLQPW